MLPPPPLDPASWLAAIVASSQDAIVSKTVAGIITSWNASAERMYGYTADEVIGQSIMLIVPEDRHDEEREILRLIADGKRIEHFDTERRTKDGRTVPVSLTISPVVDAAGRIVGASKIARDITERRSSEALRRLADRRKDEFLAMLGHELRNPLGPVLSAVEILRRKSTIDPDLREICDMLGRQVGQMARLLDDLLEVSRISSGKIEMRMEPVDLRTTIERAVEALRPAIDQRRHTLAVDLPDMPIMVQGDPARLVQLFSNLLNNAAKYTPTGGVIGIAAICDEERCQVEITDSGLGIAPELIDEIFELFVQGESTIDRAQGGLGVGLTLARSIVQRHEGTITAHSEGTGKGSRFVVCLPRHAAPAVVQPVTPCREHLSAVRQVLVVDDNRDSAWMMAELVRSLGHQAEALGDPDGAIDAIMLKQPDVVLLDIGLPGLSGYDIAAAVRERGFRGLLVAVTGYGQPGDRLRSRVAGFDLHWVKPVPPQALADLLSTDIT